MSWAVGFMAVIFPLQLVVLLVMDLVELAHIQLELRLPREKDRAHHS
jgi:hypothetical protein